MSDTTKKFPVDGTAALRIDGPALEQTHIIAFPEHARHALHAKPEPSVAGGDLNPLRNRMSSLVAKTDMINSLRNGTSSGKAVGGLTSFQAAGASLFFFVFLMGTLLFV